MPAGQHSKISLNVVNNLTAVSLDYSTALLIIAPDILGNSSFICMHIFIAFTNAESWN